MSLGPTFVTHYHRAGRSPFLNLSDLPEEQLTLVLAALARPGEQAVSARRFGPQYMALRRATEAQLRERFAAAGGRPQRRAPHYFTLGESDWFAGLYLDAGRVRLPLSALPPDATSVTYADSITAIGLGVPLGLPAPDPDHAGRVYRLDELDELTARYDPPPTPHRTDSPVTPGTSTTAWTATSRSSSGPTSPSSPTSAGSEPPRTLSACGSVCGASSRMPIRDRADSLHAHPPAARKWETGLMVGGVRASDADREAVLTRLARALGEGRITVAEFDERARIAHAARTHAELAVLVTDLPPVIW